MSPQDATMLDSRGKDRARYQTINDEPSKTKQADAKRADISEILRKYEQVGIVEHLSQVDGKYMDVSEFTDFQDAMLQLQVAEEEFLTLPSKVRELFNHSVEQWLDAAHDPEKVKELEMMINPPKEVTTPAQPEAPASPSPESPSE